MVISIDADELAMDMPFDQHLVVIDVRKPSEYEHAHIKGALNIPLEEMTDPASLVDLEEHHNLYVHCQSGYRSMVACSILKREGVHNLRNITGGFSALKGTPGIAIVHTGSVAEDTLDVQ
jgi:rhodanese-related sulfurtransferase